MPVTVKGMNDQVYGRSVSRSVVPNSLQLHGLLPARLLCPWNSPGKNTGVGCHFFLQGIFLTQGLNLGLLDCRQTLHHLSHQVYIGFHIWLNRVWPFGDWFFCTFWKFPLISIHSLTVKNIFCTYIQSRFIKASSHFSLVSNYILIDRMILCKLTAKQHKMIKSQDCLDVDTCH